jgi:hypothetical protein
LLLCGFQTLTGGAETLLGLGDGRCLLTCPLLLLRSPLLGFARLPLGLLGRALGVRGTLGLRIPVDGHGFDANGTGGRGI